MKAAWKVALCAAWGLGAAAPSAWPYGANQAPEVSERVRLDQAVEVQFSSGVSDPYYVLSGPAESYQAFQFNAMFGEALDRYAAAKSGPGEAGLALFVRLEDLTTAYRQVGAGIPQERRRDSGRPVQLAALGSPGGRGLVSRVSHLEWE